jgi:ABC-2 type transport system ATP-binding protein
VVLVTEDPVARERFAGIAGVESVTVGPVLSDRPESPNVRYTIRGQGEEFVTGVIQCLSEHRITVTEFRTELPNLEDVFLRLTGHSIRD